MWRRGTRCAQAPPTPLLSAKRGLQLQPRDTQTMIQRNAAPPLTAREGASSFLSEPPSPGMHHPLTHAWPKISISPQRFTYHILILSLHETSSIHSPGLPSSPILSSASGHLEIISSKILSIAAGEQEERIRGCKDQGGHSPP